MCSVYTIKYPRIVHTALACNVGPQDLNGKFKTSTKSFTYSHDYTVYAIISQ